MSKGKNGKRDRPETGKWWFRLNDTTAEVFIQKRKGTLTVSGKEMANVIAGAESADTSSINVVF